MDRQILVTGIRSTGVLNLGNYYSVLKNAINLQERYKAFYFVADIHSLTTHPKQENFKENVLNITKDYLAGGINPEISALYTQSAIFEEISELHAYLSMVMPLGELMRCPTFKEKVKKHPENVNYGLVGYPVLMTADVLIHKGNVVPVGEDQLVHLEIARTIVRRFNQLYGETFPEPQALIENAIRIPSLNGKGKMSKSDGKETYISLTDENIDINNKIKKAFSDPKRIYRNQPGNPTSEECNIYHLHSFFTEGKLIGEIEVQCKNAEIGCSECKQILAESIIKIVEPFREKRKTITDDYVQEVLIQGKKKAKESAQEIITEIRKAMGLNMF